MLRKIIKIDQEKCDGCGLCASACHEGAIDIVDGKARLVREHFCDGFGDCLPGCPQGAISFEERDAPEYDESAVLAAKQNKEKAKENEMAGKGIEMQKEMERRAAHAGGCPGSRFMALERGQEDADSDSAERTSAAPASRLGQWPVQIKLLPTQAPFYDGAKLLIAADCAAYAYAAFHEDFIKGKVALIGCQKLDGVDYSEKLAQIISGNDIKGVTIVRMEVPCCGGLQMAAERALKASGKFIPWQVVVIGRDGRIIEE